VLYRDGDQQNMDNTVSTSRSTIYNETVTTGCQCYTPESTETSALWHSPHSHKMAHS
jgi:hypothetical protein